ncbi:MAG: hypothetical protein WAU47_12345 [Desulfobaccales bacterium]
MAFLLMTALVIVRVMPFAVNVLVSMSHGLVAVLMPVVSMSNRFMRMLMLMLVLVMAAHGSLLLSIFFLNYYNHCPIAVNLSSLAETVGTYGF